MHPDYDSIEEYKKYIGRLMLKMAIIFPNTNFFKDKGLRVEFVNTWAEELQDLSKEQLTRGVKNFSSLEFAPSIAKFKKIALEIKDAESAFYSILNENNPTDIELKVKNKITSFDWNSLSEKELKRKFIVFYEQECKEIMYSPSYKQLPNEVSKPPAKIEKQPQWICWNDIWEKTILKNNSSNPCKEGT